MTSSTLQASESQCEHCGPKHWPPKASQKSLRYPQASLVTFSDTVASNAYICIHCSTFLSTTTCFAAAKLSCFCLAVICENSSAVIVALMITAKSFSKEESADCSTFTAQSFPSHKVQRRHKVDMPSLHREKDGSRAEIAMHAKLRLR